jgi:hypothetical protein
LEVAVSLGEKLYLAMVVSLFMSFIVLMGTLCWLDGKDARIERRRAHAKSATAKNLGRFPSGGAVSRH